MSNIGDATSGIPSQRGRNAAGRKDGDDAFDYRLSSRGITFSPIAETPIRSVIVFRDPGNIQLEF